MAESNITTEVKPRDFNSVLSSVLVVADMLERGERSTKAIMDKCSVSRPTAIRYRNDAMALIQEESKPMNREALRAMEIGRLNYWLEELTRKINTLDWNETDPKGYKVAFFKYDKLLQRIKDMGEQLHKITGMNTEVNIEISEKRRIVFVRSAPAVSRPVVEAEAIPE